MERIIEPITAEGITYTGNCIIDTAVISGQFAMNDNKSLARYAEGVKDWFKESIGRRESSSWPMSARLF
jgi:hypothetical protein